MPISSPVTMHSAAIALFARTLGVLSHVWRGQRIAVYAHAILTYIPFAPPMDSGIFDAIHRSWDVCKKKKKDLDF